MLAVEKNAIDESSTALDEPLLKLKRKLDEADWSDWRYERPSIFRVRRELRNVDNEAYEPKIISFGPYHRGNTRLAAMEKLKWLYLKKFLTRNPEMELKNYVMEIRRLESLARNAYSEEVKMGRDDFVEMVLLDGCFILEFLLAQYADRDKIEVVTTVDQFEDPIRSTIWARQMVMYDMLLLENKLPFFLLEKLLNLCYRSRQFNSLAMRSLVSFSGYLILPNYGRSDNDYLKNVIEIGRKSKPYHVLHLFHILVTDRRPQNDDVFMLISLGTEGVELVDPNSSGHPKNKSCSPTEFMYHSIRKMSRICRFTLCFFYVKASKKISVVVRKVQNVQKVQKVVGVLKFSFKMFRKFKRLLLCCCGTRRVPWVDHIISSANKLTDAGVKFKRKEKPLNFVNVTFEGNVLEIPQLHIYDSTNCLLRNLIAFEQCCLDIGADVTNYADFMGCRRTNYFSTSRQTKRP